MRSRCRGGGEDDMYSVKYMFLWIFLFKAG